VDEWHLDNLKNELRRGRNYTYEPTRYAKGIHQLISGPEAGLLSAAAYRLETGVVREILRRDGTYVKGNCKGELTPFSGRYERTGIDSLPIQAAVKGATALGATSEANAKAKEVIDLLLEESEDFGRASCGENVLMSAVDNPRLLSYLLRRSVAGPYQDEYALREAVFRGKAESVELLAAEAPICNEGTMLGRIKHPRRIYEFNAFDIAVYKDDVEKLRILIAEYKKRKRFFSGICEDERRLRRHLLDLMKAWGSWNSQRLIVDGLGG